MPVFMTFCFNAPFQFTPSHSQLNAMWLAALCFANPSFLMAISFAIYAHFYRNAIRV